MKQILREADTLARLGGDEFVAVLLDVADISICEPMLASISSGSGIRLTLAVLCCGCPPVWGYLYPQVINGSRPIVAPG